MSADEWPGEGDPLPDITLETPDGGVVRTPDLRGRKAVLFFYPKDDTPGCTTEAKDFSSLKSEFDKCETAVLGISKDLAQKHRKFIDKHGLTIDLATDAETDGLSDALGVWAEKSMYGKKFTGMVRTTYLVDRDGRIARVWRKVKVKGHAEEVLEAAQAL
jgi:peroxiredoxin Q/BCP